MPYFSVKTSNCLYVSEDEEARFQKQCEIIQNWRSLNLKPRDLFGLQAEFSQKDLNQAKRKILLHFHPDKNQENQDYSSEAFKVLTDAIEFLEHQLKPSIPLKNNIFANEEELIDRKYDDEEESFEKAFREFFKSTKPRSRATPPPILPKKKEYLDKLKALVQSDKMSPEDEYFFREILITHPEYLPLLIGEYNLLHLVLGKGGSSAFFQWLINQRYAEEALSKSKANQDVFSFAFDTNRKDCLQILFNKYGIEEFHASSIADSLALSLLLSDGDVAELDTFWFFINELNYVPRNGYHVVSVLHNALEMEDLAIFNRIYEKFKHLLLEPGQNFTHHSLIRRVLTFSPATAKTKLQKMANAGLMKYITDPLFPNTHDLNNFLLQKNALPLIQELRIKYNLMKNVGNISSEMIHQLSHASLVILLNFEQISVEDVLSNVPVNYLYYDRISNQGIPSFELTATLKDKNQEAFTRWYSTLNSQISDEMLPSFGNALLVHLINDNILSVTRILSLLEMRRISEDDSLSQAIFLQNRSAFHANFKKFQFTPEYLKSTDGQARLLLMLQYGIEFTEQQLDTIQSTFDSYFMDLAKDRVIFEKVDDCFFQLTDTLLELLIKCIDKSPKRMVCLNQFYNTELRLVEKAQYDPYKFNDDSFDTFIYNETILRSFTPLQFFMMMDKMHLAVILVSCGVDWKQNLRATKQFGVNNPSHALYNLDKISRDLEKTNPKYVEKRLVKVLSSDPDAETQKSIIDSKEIILIRKQEKIEIGFCNTDYKYEQKPVLDAQNIIDAVKRAKNDKITNSEDLDAIERYMVELGICLYSSEHISSMLLDYLKQEIQSNELQKFEDLLGADNKFEKRSKNCKAVLKHIQLYEAQLYLYKRIWDDDYKTRLSFFGFFTIKNFGFSKKEKADAAWALIKFLSKGTPIPDSCKPALNQGELGKISRISKLESESCEAKSDNLHL